MSVVYLSGSITGGRDDLPLYRRIAHALEAAGHRVLAGSVVAEEVGDAGDALHPAEIFTRDMGWIEEADVLVAEVSKPSHGVGYEIAAARHRYGIRVICLYRPAYTTRCSAMLSGDPGIELIEYEEPEEMLARLTAALRK